MLVLVTSIQPVQARAVASQSYAICGVSNSALLDPYDNIDAALYVSEESEEQFGCKSRSQRLGSNDPASIPPDVFPASACSALRYVPPYPAAQAAGGLFLSPLKTGPPSV